MSTAGTDPAVLEGDESMNPDSKIIFSLRGSPLYIPKVDLGKLAVETRFDFNFRSEWRDGVYYHRGRPVMTVR